MDGPGPVGWLLVLLGAATGAYCLLPRPSGGVAVEGVMGLGMAAMAAPAGVAPPAPLLAVVFAAVTAWGGAGGGGHGRRAHHVVEGAAMVYMALAMARGGGGHHAGGVEWLTEALAAYFAVRALALGWWLVPAGGSGPAAGARPPEVAAACRATLCLGMLAMLLTR